MKLQVSASTKGLMPVPFNLSIRGSRNHGELFKSFSVYILPVFAHFTTSPLGSAPSLRCIRFPRVRLCLSSCSRFSLSSSYFILRSSIATCNDNVLSLLSSLGCALVFVAMLLSATAVLSATADADIFKTGFEGLLLPCVPGCELTVRRRRCESRNARKFG